jgi:hypothetical protein
MMCNRFSVNIKLLETVKYTPLSAVVFRSAVLNAGYRISSTHVNPLGLKSDAPWDVIWDIMRCWVNLIKLFSLWYSDDCMSRFLFVVFLDGPDSLLSI